MTIRILVVDDHPVVREGLVAMLSTVEDFEVVGEAAEGVSAVTTAIKQRPDVVLMDIELPPTDGIEALQEIAKRAPGSKVLVFSAFDSEDRILRAVQAGALGYVLKGVPREELFGAIRTVATGGSHLQPAVAAKLMQRLNGSHAPLLTARQLEVVGMLARGATNKDVARSIGVGERTVKYHVAGVFERLGAANRTEAVAIAVRLGLITLETPGT
jgi:DNA-binding NarL/FixJ family response regulator